MQTNVVFSLRPANAAIFCISGPPLVLVGMTPILLLLGLSVAYFGRASDINNQTLYWEFVASPARSLKDFSLVSDCIHRDMAVGLSVAHDVCWDGQQAYVRCPQRSAVGVHELDDFRKFRVHLLPPEDFEAKLTAQWSAAAALFPCCLSGCVSVFLLGAIFMAGSFPQSMIIDVGYPTPCIVISLGDKIAAQ